MSSWNCPQTERISPWFISQLLLDTIDYMAIMSSRDCQQTVWISPWFATKRLSKKTDLTVAVNSRDCSQTVWISPWFTTKKLSKQTSWTGRHAWSMSVFNGRATQTRRVHIDQVGLAQHRATRRATSSKFYIWRMQVQCRIPPVRIVRATRFLFS